MEIIVKSLKLPKSACITLFSVTMAANTSFAKTTDMGVCFLKTDKQTMQSKINEIAQSNQEKIIIQQQARFFNDLTNLFVPVDTFNFKMFWVSRPNNDWLTSNCFKFGYIALKDYNRRAITRVYSTPTNIVAKKRTTTRLPASVKALVPQADPPAQGSVLTPTDSAPFDPQSQQTPKEPTAPVAKAPADTNAQQNYAVPQINLYNYYTGASSGDSSQPAKQDQKTETINTKKEDSLNVNVNVGENSKEDLNDSGDSKFLRRRSVYDLPDYLEDPSYFLEINPLMGYENVEVTGSGTTNKFNLFGYGTDIKLGYRFNQHFNYYLKGRYMALELRSADAPATVNLSEKSDITYGIGIEHVASRFLSLALEYNALHIQSFEQSGVPTNVNALKEDIQTLNLDFKLNFISRDNFKMGLHGNYGIVLADNSDELIYDFKTKLYILRAFEKDYFGLNLGYEQNKFLYASGPTSESTRKRFVFGLSFGFDL